MSELMYSFPSELKSRDASRSLPNYPFPSLQAVVFNLFAFPHVSQSEASGRLGTYLT